jgi:phthalate 4,5-cis-dihydrodiol dehydrogenase
MLPTFLGDSRVRLVAAADPRESARRQFAADFSPRVYETVDGLCDNPEVEVVYLATPHQFHAEHTVLAASRGKHVLVEKPMAVTLAECASMIAACHAHGVHLIVGHSHSFDAPFRRTRDIIASGEYGTVRMITALNFTDFLYRPRRREELLTEAGGGVVFSQAAHQVDIARLLGGGKVTSVRAGAGAWDPARPTEGAYGAHLTFDGGAFASLTYSGYAHFDSDEFCGWINEMGAKKDQRPLGDSRKRISAMANEEQEALVKTERNYGGSAYIPPEPGGGSVVLAHQQFGLFLVSCDGADLRPLPTGVMIYDDRGPRLDALPLPSVPRREVIDELYDAVVFNRLPVHSGAWAMATMEVCLAILRSSRSGVEVPLEHQVELRSH